LPFPLNLSKINSADKILIYCRLPEIFRSWFWRFFDHLFQLIFYNFIWFFSLVGIGWTALHFGLIESSNKLNFMGIYFIFLATNIISIGWAYLIFKIFTEGDGELSDVWFGTKKYFFKATGVSAISGIFTLFILLNIRFYFFLHSPHHFLDYLLIGITLWILIFWLINVIYQWPVLFFQNPSFFEIFHKSFLLALGSGILSLGILLFFLVFMILFSAIWPLWFFVGVVFFFSFQCVTVEKQFLRYKITYRNKPLEPFLELLDHERKRGWRDFLKPWENR
jgi:hypothetical protein